MSTEQDTAQTSDVLHYFVDEASDPALFDARGRSLIGLDGCSAYFMLGKLEVDDPAALGVALDALRAELLADPYFRRVPSMQAAAGKTAVFFHAKDDLAEVRREVFRVLARHGLRFSAVIKSKHALLAYVRERNAREEAYRYKGDEIYDGLVMELFRRLRPFSDQVNICYAKRGSKTRSAAFKEALEAAEARFERDYGFARDSKVTIVPDVPASQAGLQAADYFLWALQRHYERKESRYLELVWPQVVEIHDLDAAEGGRRGVTYNKKRPLIEDERAPE
ncbi:DUF3800 domain-containing protein [Nevskia sp.]|uniref:DUF3800 domain-containing protein n=1 Tax=Nevskia sp. TaxID=1929292 RepID=UPI0025F27EA1|nr:DUF3800 domain-containing protein [Nevskia sp.]